MKLTLQQQSWLRDYENYRKAGGFYNSADSQWMDFEDIPRPEWYHEYLKQFEEQIDLFDEPEVDIAPMKEFNSSPTDWKEDFIEAGRRGGNKTKERGSQYYSDIAKKRWLNR